MGFVVSRARWPRVRPGHAAPVRSARPARRDRAAPGSVIAVPPPVFAALARDPAAGGYDLSSLELIISGGAPLSPELQEAMAARFPGAAVGQGYGLTETTAVICLPARRPTCPAPQAGSPRTRKCAWSTPPPAATPPRRPRQTVGTRPAGDGGLPRPAPGNGRGPRPARLAAHRGCRPHRRPRQRVHHRPAKELIKVNAYQVAPAELEALLRPIPGSPTWR